MSNPALDHVYACACCRETFHVPAGQEPRLDNDLGAPVCPECKRNLAWAGAYLKQSGIHPCKRQGRIA